MQSEDVEALKSMRQNSSVEVESVAQWMGALAWELVLVAPRMGALVYASTWAHNCLDNSNLQSGSLPLY